MFIRGCFSVDCIHLFSHISDLQFVQEVRVPYIVRLDDRFKMFVLVEYILCEQYDAGVSLLIFTVVSRYRLTTFCEHDVSVFY